MGEVWAASALGDASPRDVAIKVLLASAAMNPELVRRFEREAKIASAIDSPYVCKLIRVAEGEDGSHLLLFELLDGESLADRLRREQYLPFSEVGAIVDDVLQGLVAAHASGVIHRDLKPGNVFLEHPRDTGAEAVALGFDRAVILDFGISKLSRREAERDAEPTLTAFDATLGSFAYMAPEQVRGAARADARADVYALATVAFRALAGRLPFEGNTPAVLLAMKLDRPAPSLGEITGEQWPAGIERFLGKALARDRDQRFATTVEALEAWRSILPSNMPRRRVSIEAPTLPSRPSPTTHEGTWPSYASIDDSPTEIDEPHQITERGLGGPGKSGNAGEGDGNRSNGSNA
jgi:serine/threonine-protein kinase